MDIKESRDNLKYAALNGCWKKLWLKLVSNFQKFTSQHNERRNVIVLACQFPDLEEVDIQKVLESYAAE